LLRDVVTVEDVVLIADPLHGNVGYAPGIPPRRVQQRTWSMPVILSSARSRSLSWAASPQKTAPCEKGRIPLVHVNGAAGDGDAAPG
jgi:hypothetical protein